MKVKVNMNIHLEIDENYMDSDFKKADAKEFLMNYFNITSGCNLQIRDSIEEINITKIKFDF